MWIGNVNFKPTVEMSYLLSGSFMPSASNQNIVKTHA